MFIPSLRTHSVLHRRVASVKSWTRRFTTETQTKDAIRRLLRETAQPVAVVTSILDIDDRHNASPDCIPPGRAHPFHGATLSSFSSIALDPHPLVSFSLRIPSRLAVSLKAYKERQRSDTHMVVNILSCQQQDVAVRFSRADIYEDPFKDTEYHLTDDGLPVLTGSLGALTCSLVQCIPLHELCTSEVHTHKMGDRGVISELFISRVLRVEDTRRPNDASPLLYHHREYASAQLLKPLAPPLDKRYVPSTLR